MFRATAVLPLLMLWSASFADPGVFTAGPKFQKVYNLYFENGLELGYTRDGLWNRRVQFGLSYVTSRLGSALGSHALRQDNYLLSTGLHFRPVKRVDPYIQANIGWFHYDTEIPEFDYIDNNSPIFTFLWGLKWNIYPKVGGVYLDMGYNLIQGDGTKGPATLYPLVFNLGLSFNIFPRGAG